METFPVDDIIEMAITKSVDKIVGTRDTNLNTIVKMDMLNSMRGVDSEKMQAVIKAIQDNNKVEEHYIHQEYQLSMDSSGNLFYIIDEKDSECS
jgi:hypothetical protein